MTEKSLTTAQKAFFDEFEKLSGQSFEDAIPRIARDTHRVSVVVLLNDWLQMRERTIADTKKEHGVKVPSIVLETTQSTRKILVEAASRDVFTFFSEAKLDIEGFVGAITDTYNDRVVPLWKTLMEKRVITELPPHLPFKKLSNHLQDYFSSAAMDVGVKKIEERISPVPYGQAVGERSVFFEMRSDIYDKQRITDGFLPKMIANICKEKNPDADLGYLLEQLQLCYKTQKELDRDAEYERKAAAVRAENAAKKQHSKSAPTKEKSEPKQDVFEVLNGLDSNTAPIQILQAEIRYAQEHKLSVLIQPHVVAKALYYATGIEAQTNIKNEPIQDADTKKLVRMFSNGDDKVDLLAKCGILICAAGAIEPKQAATYIHDRVIVGSKNDVAEAALSDKITRDGLSNLGKVHGAIIEKAKTGRF